MGRVTAEGGMSATEWWGQDVMPRIRWKISMTRSVEVGECIPDGYGLAWRLWDRDAVVCMPIPLNFIAGAVRGVYHWIRGGFFHRAWSPRWSEAIRYGESRGAASEYGPTSLPARLRTSLMRIAGPDHDSTNAEQLAKVAKLLAPEAMEPRGPTPDDMRTFGEAI